MLILLVYLQQHSFQNLILLLRHSYLEYSKFTTTHFFNKLYNIYIWVAPLTSSRCSYLGLRTPLRQRSAWPAPLEWFRSAVRPSGPRRAGQTVACCSVPSLRPLHPSGRWRPRCSRSTSSPHPTSQSPPWRWRSCSMKRQLSDDLHSRKKKNRGFNVTYSLELAHTQQKIYYNLLSSWSWSFKPQNIVFKQLIQILCLQDLF